MTSFHYKANVRNNFNPRGPEISPVREDPNYTIPASIVEAEVIRLLLVFSLRGPVAKTASN